MNGRSRTTPPTQPGGRQGASNPRRRRHRGRSVERPIPLATASTVAPRNGPGMGSRLGWTTLAHSEVILQVTAKTTGNNILVVPLIPALLYPADSTGFMGRAKHIAGHASLYSKYKWQSLSLFWTPSCPTTTPGNVVMKVMPSYCIPTPTEMLDLMDTDALVLSPYVKGQFTPRINRGELNTISASGFAALPDEDKGDYSTGKLVIAVNKQSLELTMGTVTMQYRVAFNGPVTPVDSSAPGR